MKAFVVRLNSDTRDGLPYCKYPTLQEYKSIHESSPMDGFHEAVNFLSESGVVRGYLPPKHLTSIRSDEPFALVTITAKTAKVGGDMVVGIQAGCRYEGESTRLGGTRASRTLGLNWHYSCGESLSLLLPQQIPNARSLVLGGNGSWVRGPTTEISKATFRRILSKARTVLTAAEDIAKLNRIAQSVRDSSSHEDLDVAVESEFDAQVAHALESDLGNIIGNRFPGQVPVRSFQYQRDPSVVAYALRKADGICGDCGDPAPFVSSRTGLPYLEVHHIKMLKDGGADTIDNVVALCPNCHRKRHHG
ncbi:MAG: HNH endonuclease [Thiobacillus sp.]|nr:HNH endonuclease [Thiobacillus sp.]